MTRAAKTAAKIKVTDAMFAIAALAPVLLAAAGRPALALMLFCPLLIGACLLAGYYEHRDRKPPHWR
jgi:hypothetical protein